ncbi:MAG: hypothetical protein A2Y13_11825 [Planctomycetes bacterium GWC2_45_44]|nr:MAG: hypothetical protein A2Y13_11825 [Planctomycetes bacterium GWC2_45_44]HBR19377.1 hypothetical protein [Phycisphaerales bacterium]
MSQSSRIRILRLIVIAVAMTAVSGCNESVKKDDSVNLYVDAVMLDDSNKPDEAIAKLQKATEVNPEFALAYSLLGGIYLKQSKLPESIEAYEKATALNQWSYEDFRDLGKVYRLMNNFASAADAYAKASELDPQNADVRFGAADSYYNMQDYEKALEYGKAAKSLAPTNSEIEKLLADIYTAMQDNELAIDSCKRVLELKGADSATMLTMALCQLRSEHYEDAQTTLNDLIAVEPNNADALRHLGFTCLKLRKIDVSIEKYEAAAGVNPKDWRAYKGLGVAYMMKYRMFSSLDDPQAVEFRQKALDSWSKSLDLNPTQDKLLKLYKKYTN